MDAMLYFKNRAQIELADLDCTGDSSLSLKEVQEHVARRAGYSSWPQMGSAAVPDLELAAAVDLEPWLTTHGLGPQRYEVGESWSDFAQGRIDLRAKHETVELVHHWLLLNIERCDTVNTTADSYFLKGLVERALEIGITHGEVIAAAMIAGYPYRRDGQNLPRAVFGMSQTSIDAVLRGSGR
jgi:hypothetical protein